MRRLLLFAKRPRAGRVKTRLVPPLDPAQALELYRAFLADADRTLPATELANRFLDVYGDRPDLPRRYFSDRLIRSWRARHGWVEPDLRPLDF